MQTWASGLISLERSMARGDPRAEENRKAIMSEQAYQDG